MPGSPLDPRAEGTNDLIRNGATICTKPEDVLTDIEPMREGRGFSGLREDPGAPGEPLWSELELPGVNGEATPRVVFNGKFDEPPALAAANGGEATRLRIVALLGPSPTPIDDLARAAEASIRDVRVVLLELELAGRLEYSGGNRVALIDASR